MIRPLLLLASQVLMSVLTLARPSATGWIGNWEPGIGDPSVGGWFTVVLYGVAALLCLRTAFRLPSGLLEVRAWRSLGALFLLLGVNKQLDLQSALTALGRLLARQQGWYGDRRLVQVAFIIAVAVFCLASLAVLHRWVRYAPPPTWTALVGTGLLASFVVLRAASFHKMDRLLGWTLLGLRFNWILEMGGLLVVCFGAAWRIQSIPSSAVEPAAPPPPS